MSDLIQLEPQKKSQQHFLYDSLEKTILVFFAAVAKEPITYTNETSTVLPLVVSPLIWRGFTCPSGCGACCGRATLDYIPGEPRPKEAVEKTITVNNKEFKIYCDEQNDLTSYFCRNLDTDARCSIYDVRPFSCDFALLNINTYKTHRLLNCRKFGRHWAWKRVDEQRGTLCEMLPIQDEWIANTRRRLYRLHMWTSYFQLKTWLPEILEWSSQDPYTITKELKLGF